jgi:hypothetical protein
VLVGAIGFLGVMWVVRKFVGQGPVALIWLAILIVGIVIVVRNLMSNRKVADAAPEARTQALAFTPDSAHAALYILRKQFVGQAVGVNVEIDGRAVAQLKSPRFTRILLSPGAHKVSGYAGPASNRKPSAGDLEFTAAAGEIVVLECAVEPGMIGTTTKFKRVELESVRAKLARTRMVAPDLGSV